MGLQSTDIKLGALEPGANQMELPTLITWTPDKSTLAPTVEQPKQPNPNQLPEVWVQDRHNGQTRLTYNPEREIWSETIRLPVGNMPLKFLVDGQQHITSDLPLAPEEDGELVNYVTVMPPLPPQPMDAPSGGREHHPPMHSASTWLKEPGNPEDPSGSSPPWTNEIPIQLIHAQREEEEWNEHKSLTAEQRKTIPIPPMPLHPHPPLLPRHLDKPVLGTKAKKTALASAVASTPGRSKGKDKDKKASGGRRSERDRTHGPSPLSQDTKGGSLPESLGLPTNTTSAILVEAPHGDDDAVLPVPSHVVLHHLGTSAIRDGVIAVCDTVRYKKKVRLSSFWCCLGGADVMGSISRPCFTSRCIPRRIPMPCQTRVSSSRYPSPTSNSLRPVPVNSLLPWPRRDRRTLLCFTFLIVPPSLATSCCIHHSPCTHPRTSSRFPLHVVLLLSPVLLTSLRFISIPGQTITAEIHSKRMVFVGHDEWMVAGAQVAHQLFSSRFFSPPSRLPISFILRSLLVLVLSFPASWQVPALAYPPPKSAT